MTKIFKMVKEASPFFLPGMLDCADGSTASRGILSCFSGKHGI
jgi:hypothetical protein